MDAQILLVVILIVDCVKGTAYSEWSFSGEYGLGPKDWTYSYPNCAGPTTSQSPIDIPHETFYNELLTPFKFHGYDKLSPDDFEVVNKGKKVEVVIKEEKRGTATFTGGGYADRYKAVELHFHWGINDTDCAGHALHGECYPLELHVVNLNENYNNLKEAVSVKGGVAVLAFLFKLSKEDNEILQPYLHAVENVKHKGQRIDNFTEIFFAFFMGSEISRYYRYDGSLGYPPCLETIPWTVIEPASKHTVSKAQLSALREIYETSYGASPAFKLEFNHRPLQDIGERRVDRSFNGAGSVAAVTAVFGLATFSMISQLIL